MSYLRVFSKCLMLPFLALTGCATLVNGTHQKIGVCSNPSEANVRVDTVYKGRTPICLDLSREDCHVVRIELDGYFPYEVVLQRKISGWVFGNIIFGGVIGLAVDAISGGIYRLTPDQIQAELEMNQGRGFIAQQDTSYISVVLKPDPKWEKVGSLYSAN